MDERPAAVLRVLFLEKNVSSVTTYALNFVSVSVLSRNTLSLSLIFWKMSLFQNTQPNEKIGLVEGETGRTEGMGKLTETDARS